MNEAARRALEEMMKGYEYQSDLGKKYAQMSAQARAEGRAEGEARALLTVLQARGIAVPDSVRERILAQKDLEQLKSWLNKSVVASSVNEVFDEPN
jgi:hypothetical protein